MKKLLLVVVLSLVGPTLGATDIMIAWNDLGMHCANQDFSSFVVLPPFNNVHAQVIQVGDATHLPVVLATNLRITYEIPGNTYSVGKTNFWDYAYQIFGATLPPNIGLTGNGLTGTMVAQDNNYIVTGIPITPYTDADLTHEFAFQLGLLKAYDSTTNVLLTTTQPVIPVSNEISCISSGCHTSPSALLHQHDAEGGFDPNVTPILCASCHSSNALGTPGKPGLPSLSEVVHSHHGSITNDCYKCHPGPTTQCLRDVMKNQHGFTCQTCHGSVSNVGASIAAGRNPWLQEPSCGALAVGSQSCHGSKGTQYSEEPGKLFRQSRGHGGLFCSACHGEPHAIVPSGQPNDNVQQIALQGVSGTLRKCEVCHGVSPTGAGPHGIMSSNCCVGITGNVDMIGIVNLVDLTSLVNYLTGAGYVLPCPAEANINGSGIIDLGDLSSLVNYLTGGGFMFPACP